MSTIREQFEAWAKDEGLIQESHGIMSINSMCGIARKAFDAGIAHAEAAKATGTAQTKQSFENIEELPLPETNYNGYSDGSEPLYTTEMMRAYGQQCAEAACRDKNGNHVSDLSAWLDEAKDEIEVQGAAFHATSLKLKIAEAELAARQPAPVVSSDLRNAAQLIMDLYDDMRMGKQAIPAFDALRAALAATAAPALSQAKIHDITIQEACKIGGGLVDEIPADDLTALGCAIAERILAATKRQPAPVALSDQKIWDLLIDEVGVEHISGTGEYAQYGAVLWTPAQAAEVFRAILAAINRSQL